MNPHKEICASSVYQQLDCIAEQVAAELLEQHSSEQEANSSVAGDEMVVSISYYHACSQVLGSSTGRRRTVLPQCEKLKRLRLPIEVVLDGINTVLYEKLHFLEPFMGHNNLLENSFIDKVL